MAIGFIPKHTENITLDNLTQEQFLVLAQETLKKENWNVGLLCPRGLIAYTDLGMFSRNSELLIRLDQGKAVIQSSSLGSEMVDWGRNKKNVDRFIRDFGELKLAFTEEELMLKYTELKDQPAFREADDLNLLPETATGKIKNFFSVFIPRPGFFITPILLDLNILIFLLMSLSGVNVFMPESESLLKWGANFRPLTLEGEWWRLITNCFLHIGIFHLLLNMYALLYIGFLLEPRLGRTRFLSAYLLTGITASMTSLSWHDFIISAGASGAIFGMYGVFLAMLTTQLIEKSTRKSLLVSIAVFVGYNLVNGLKDGIDNAAHIGGLLCGLLIGYAFIPGLKKPTDSKLKFGTIGLLSVLILLASFTLYKKLPNDVGEYDVRMQNFFTQEALALEVYNLPQDTPKEKLLYGLRERGIYYWNENLKLLESFKSMDLPLEIRTRNRLLKEYCELRIKCYELVYQAVLEDTDQYKDQIDNYGRQIEAKVKEIGGGQ
jgi:rhomboid protease GluP